MYFKDKKSTNIDDELNDKKTKNFHINLNSKNILLIIIGAILLVFGIIFLITLNTKNKVNYFLELNGNELLTIYKDNEYIEPGYTAKDNKGNDLTKEVIIDSNLDTSTTGDYEIIYTFHDKSLKRYITVTDKPVGATYIYLKGDSTIYLNINDKYIEPGYLVIDSIDSSLTDKVTVYNKIDTSKKGTYQIVYTVTNSTGVTTSAKRTIIVMDGNISLSLDNEGYTNKKVGINIYIMDNYFDYLLLPDGTQIKDKSYTYKVTSNGEYKFISYNKTGKGTESTITVSNIDKEGPTGSCSGSYGNGQSTITISAQDKAGISKYNFNGTNYTNNIITINKEYSSVTITVYDKLGNSSDISCKLTKNNNSNNPIPSSNQDSPLTLNSDGVIVKVKATTDKQIAGYYFNYSSKLPDKSTGGYLETNRKEFDVVRLPGITYVWVKYANGETSGYKTIIISNNTIPNSLTGRYIILKGMSLDTYLKNKGWSLEELNKLIARSVRAGGLYTKTGAATAATALEVVLIQKYGIKIPYRMGGKVSTYGAYKYWGTYSENKTYEGYDLMGLDCGGFVNWSYYNTGVDKTGLSKDNYYFWDGIEYSESNGEVGDILRRFSSYNTTEHVAIIIGKTDTAFIVAEAYGLTSGVVLNTYPYNKPDGYTIIKGEKLTQKYTMVSESTYPSGF